MSHSGRRMLNCLSTQQDVLPLMVALSAVLDPFTGPRGGFFNRGSLWQMG